LGLQTSKSSRFAVMLSKNQPNGLCFDLFAMIQTCAHLYSSEYSPHVI